jgi:hypothetical protein
MPSNRSTTDLFPKIPGIVWFPEGIGSDPPRTRKVGSANWYVYILADPIAGRQWKNDTKAKINAESVPDFIMV